MKLSWNSREGSASSVGEPLEQAESLLLITIISQGMYEDSCVLPATSYSDISEMIST
jgi:hypothetical protein